MNYQSDYLGISLKMAIALAVMVACLFGVSFLLKKMMRTRIGSKSGRHIRIIENCYVGVKKTISLVEVPGAVLVIAMAGDRITLLSKVKSEEMGLTDQI